MSTIIVAKVATETNTTQLILATGNTATGAGQIRLEAVNNNISMTGTLIVSNGSVGIGTSSPTSNLHVIGNANINGNVTANVITATTLNGNVTANVITATTLNVSTGNITTLIAPTISGNTTVQGQITLNGAFGIGSGFSNLVSFITPGSGSWTIPANVNQFKATVVGAGGSGGGTSVAAGQTGNGGGSGAAFINIIMVVNGQTTVSYNVGAGGTASATNGTGNTGGSSNITYNSVTFGAGGGVGGATYSTINGGGAGGAVTGTVLFGFPGNKGRTGGVAANTNPVTGIGADAPLGYGMGGDVQGNAAGGAGIAGQGYGSGGSGGKNGTLATARPSGAGAGGIILFEW